MLAAAAALSALCVAGVRRLFVRHLRRPQVRRSWLWWLSGTKYAWRRRFERWMRIPFWLIGVLLLLASVPFAVGELHGWLLGSSFSLIGLASGLLAFVRTMQQPKSRAEKQASWAIPSSWIASFGAAFLLYGVLLLSYAFGWWAQGGAPVLGIPPSWVLSGAVVLAIVTGLRGRPQPDHDPPLLPRPADGGVPARPRQGAAQRDRPGPAGRTRRRSPACATRAGRSRPTTSSTPTSCSPSPTSAPIGCAAATASSCRRSTAAATRPAGSRPGSSSTTS